MYVTVIAMITLVNTFKPILTCFHSNRNHESGKKKNIVVNWIAEHLSRSHAPYQLSSI